MAYTALINSGDPSPGATFTLISVTALVLGGASLAGGRATIFGSLLGALNLFLIGYVLSTFDFGSVQGLVNDLSYGVILVLSLLLTLALPYLQRWLRYVSPLLVFVMLSFTFIGVALHATFDYTTLSPLGGPPADPAQATPAETAQWIAAPLLEQVEIGPEFLRSLFSMRLSQMAVLLLAVVASLRILIWQAEQRRLTPLLYAAIGAGGLLGVWLLTDPAASVSRLGH